MLAAAVVCKLQPSRHVQNVFMLFLPDENLLALSPETLPVLCTWAGKALSALVALQRRLLVVSSESTRKTAWRSTAALCDTMLRLSIL